MRFNVWPLVIMGLLLMGITLAIWTIVTASGSVVVEEDMYMQKYQEVDKNANEIVASQDEFFSKYSVTIANKSMLVGEHQLHLVVTDKGGNTIQNAKIEAKIGRYETKSNNLELKNFSHENGRYTSEKFMIEKLGRYAIDVSVAIDGKIGYKNFYVYKDGMVSDVKDLQRHN